MARNPIGVREAKFRLKSFLEREGYEVEGRHDPELAFSSFGGLTFKFGGTLFADEARVDTARTWGDSLAKFTVTVNWSSTSRSPAAALAALDSYEKAVRFAARLQTFFDELPPVDFKKDEADAARFA